MRITRIEKGAAYGRGYIKPYVRVYTQPVTCFALAWLYHHVWEKSTWRILRRVENLRKKYSPETDLDYIPYTNRQDIRCDTLRHRKRVEISMSYEEPIERW